MASSSRIIRIVVAGLLGCSALALAQQGPESLLPPGFDRPEPRPAAKSAEPQIGAMPVIAGGDGAVAADSESKPAAKATKSIPSIKEITELSEQELDALLGLQPKYDIPPAARRAVRQSGLIDADEGGLPAFSLAHQNAALVRAALAGNGGNLVSRWGHILLRRALVSRLDAPAGMMPADFVAQRAALLARMGEGEAARALVQDVDPASYSPELTQAAIDAYLATADITGICPVVYYQGNARKDQQWKVFQAVCKAFNGGSGAMGQLDRLTRDGALPKIDMLLAQKYAGAAGTGARNVKIEWGGVSDLTPWRYAFAVGTGLMPPPGVMQAAGNHYAYLAATAPMLALPDRANAADRAAAGGILSSAAMVDLYSQIYANNEINGDWANRAVQLRDAYVAKSVKDRLTALQQLWESGDAQQGYSRKVLTAYAAARMPVTSDLVDDAPNLITAMLAAGLDGNALRWNSVVGRGSLGWALLALATPEGKQTDSSALSSFFGSDNSEKARKSGFMLAGLAGLQRLSPDAEKQFSDKLGLDFHAQSRWTGLIDQAAAVGNSELVVLLAGLGMQGNGWDKMTPRYLYHIIAALNRVGLGAEARMIAAEAVARA